MSLRFVDSFVIVSYSRFAWMLSEAALLLGEIEMKSIDGSFYKSKTWQRVQADYMKKAHYLCERCLKRGLYIPAKIVHHKQHLSKELLRNPNITYGFGNLEALCFDCHNKEHLSRGSDYGKERKARGRRYEIDKHGNLIISRDERLPP